MEAATARSCVPAIAEVVLEEMANSATETGVICGRGNSGTVGAFRQVGPLQGSSGGSRLLSPREVFPATVAEASSLIALSGREVDAWASQSPHEAHDRSARHRSAAAQIDAFNVSVQERIATADAPLRCDQEETAKWSGHCTQYHVVSA
jgi:hypothetical protein